MQESLATRKPGEPWYLLLVKILLWQVLAVLLVELCLCIAGLGEEEVFKLDPVLGTRHLCNKKVTWHNEGQASCYFDADGMREPGLTVAKPPGTYRIAMLGDSLSEALQVPLSENFGSRIEKSVSRELSRPVQLLNFGVSGYSTAQEYLQLKMQVLKYKPDLVLVCYNSRDCFENWSPPDEVLTNVRPTALHLPGRKLVIDTSSVTNWMKSPRARFLQRVEFLRQNSRLWGLFSASELDWSLHNDAYKKMLLLVTRPGKVVRASMDELKAGWKVICARISGCPKSIAQGGASQAIACKAEGNLPASYLKQSTDTKVATVKDKSAANTAGKEQAGRSIYYQLIERTLGSLLAGMNDESNAAGARFVVVAVPVRTSLSTEKGMETFDFNDEVKMLKRLCKLKGIDLVDIHSKARALPTTKDKDSLFFFVHLSPKGHEFVAGQLAPFVNDYIRREQRK